MTKVSQGTEDFRIRLARLEDSAEVARLSAQFADYLRGLGDHCPGPLTQATYRRDGFGPKPRFFGLVAEKGGWPGICCTIPAMTWTALPRSR